MNEVMEKKMVDTGFCGLFVSLDDIRRELKISHVSDDTTSLIGDVSFDMIRDNSEAKYNYEEMNAFALKFGLPTFSQELVA